MSSDDCYRGPCFNNSIDSNCRKISCRNYTYSNQYILTDSLNNHVMRITPNSLFIGNYCLGSEEPYMKKYTGKVVFE